MSEQTALEDSEGSEYLPSESELEELGRKGMWHFLMFVSFIKFDRTLDCCFNVF